MPLKKVYPALFHLMKPITSFDLTATKSWELSSSIKAMYKPIRRCKPIKELMEFGIVSLWMIAILVTSSISAFRIANIIQAYSSVTSHCYQIYLGTMASQLSNNDIHIKPKEILCQQLNNTTGRSLRHSVCKLTCFMISNTKMFQIGIVLVICH